MLVLVVKAIDIRLEWLADYILMFYATLIWNKSFFQRNNRDYVLQRQEILFH